MIDVPEYTGLHLVGFVAAILGVVVVWILVGALCTWLTGKVLGREEITFPNSVGVTLIYWAANPLIPFILFFWDYYIGLPPFFADATDALRSLYYSIFSFVVTCIIWIALFKYLFGWDTMDSCTFCLAQGCVSVILAATLIFFVVLVAFSLGGG